jgi:hypothetical protein
MIRGMTAILYPVAANADQALNAALGHAARESDARRVAKEPVVYTTDACGPAFATREAAQEAYAAKLAEPYLRLVEQILSPRPPRPVEPTYEDGRRWPAPQPAPATAWRLMVSYWRIASAERPLEAPQARRARTSKAPLAPEALAAMARQPMRPFKPQQPLDIGLFEIRLPEAPHIVAPDE